MQTINQEEIVKILPKGLMTIPINLRRALGFIDNGLAKIKVEKGRLIIEPLFTLPYPIRSYTDKEIKEFLKFDKEESKVLKKKGLL